LQPEELARIDIAAFSGDLWEAGRGPAFFRTVLKAPNIQWLHMFSAGTDDPVFAAVRSKGTRVTSSIGASARPIAHTVIMQMLALCRNGRRWALAQSRHEWQRLENVDVEGRTMGIIGLGHIGAEVARLAQAFGVRVIGMRRTPQGDEPCETWASSRLHELLPMVDTLVLTAALTDETQGMIGAAELALLPAGAHIINVGRGLLIDEPAMIEALQSGHLGGAALDVFAVEPLPELSPLWDMPNVIVTPHGSGNTGLATSRMAEIFGENLRRWTHDEPLLNEIP
jgi:phosphoglycerate dehydrogenase-like enzyme